MSTETLNSSLFKVYKSGAAIAQSNNAEITINQELPDTTNKDSGRWAENTDGRFSATGSVEGLASNGIVDDLYQTLITPGGHNVIVGAQTETGDVFFSGTARFSNITVSSPGDNQPVTYSAQFTFSGEVAKNIV